MHKDLEKLIGLQRQDVEGARLRDELAAMPKRLAGLAAKLAALEGQRAVVVELIAKEAALGRRLESDIADHKGKIAKVTKQLDQATSTVQVTAFEHEIGFAKGEIAKLEDAELEGMERTEGLETQLGVADAAIVEAAATLERERARALTTMAADKAALVAVETERAAVRATIGEAALSTYDRIAKAKGVALSEALNQKCMVCQMMIRPQRWNDLRERDNDELMTTCESCGRLLYYDPARDAPQRKTVAVESIAASIVRSL